MISKKDNYTIFKNTLFFATFLITATSVLKINAEHPKHYKESLERLERLKYTKCSMECYRNDANAECFKLCKILYPEYFQDSSKQNSEQLKALADSNTVKNLPKEEYKKQ